MATIFERDFELHHAVERHVSKCYNIMDPNGNRQWARPCPRVFILKELNAAECEGLACETSFSYDAEHFETLGAEHIQDTLAYMP